MFENLQELEGQLALRERHSRNQATLSEAMAQVRELEAALLEAPPEIVRERDGHAVRVQAALEAFAAGSVQQDSVEEELRWVSSVAEPQPRHAASIHSGT